MPRVIRYQYPGVVYHKMARWRFISLAAAGR